MWYDLSSPLAFQVSHYFVLGFVFFKFSNIIKLVILLQTPHVTGSFDMEKIILDRKAYTLTTVKLMWNLKILIDHCYGLNFCVPQKFICWNPNLQKNKRLHGYQIHKNNCTSYCEQHSELFKARGGSQSTGDDKNYWQF